MSIAIMTDSNAGISQEEAKREGIYVLPMPFTINEQEYFEDINLTQEQFYEMLENDANVLTSQPTPGALEDAWRDLLKEYDTIVHIPMSSGLSGACQTAMILAEEDEFAGKVFVVNSQRISVTQKRDVYDALALAKAGRSAEEIQMILEENKFNSSIYITVATLDYLKKGGRLTPAVAALGSILKIKPILTIQGDKLDKFNTARTMKKARRLMIDAIKEDIEKRHFGDDCEISVAYTQDLESAEDFRQQIEEEFGKKITYINPLSLSISCHIGPGALAIAAVKKII